MKNKVKTKKKVKSRRGRRAPRPIGLHAKKLEILAAVPIMPCSAISNDWQGLRFAHTQAEKVYQVYRRECVQRGLVIRRVEGHTRSCEIPEIRTDEKGQYQMTRVLAILFEGIWEICDVETGQCEQFGGSGCGRNDVWSANSAQTIAKKQALLDYFETAWPQPTDWLKVIHKSIEEMPPGERVEAYRQIFRPEAWSVLDATGAVKALTEFYGSFGKESNQRKAGQK